MREITGHGLLGKMHRLRTLDLSDNPIGEFSSTLLHLNPLRNGADANLHNVWVNLRDLHKFTTQMNIF